MQVMFCVIKVLGLFVCFLECVGDLNFLYLPSAPQTTESCLGYMSVNFKKIQKITPVHSSLMLNKADLHILEIMINTTLSEKRVHWGYIKHRVLYSTPKNLLC